MIYIVVLLLCIALYFFARLMKCISVTAYIYTFYPEFYEHLPSDVRMAFLYPFLWTQAQWVHYCQKVDFYGRKK